MDLTINLTSLEFETGLSEYERNFTYLRSRAAALSVCGCGHAVFLTQLLSLLREKLKDMSNKSHRPLNIGILGGGSIGKKLAMVLLAMPGFRPSDINISTKRPETLSEFSKSGVPCYRDNRRLAGWADVLFLCVARAQLLHVCAELRSHLPAHCLVYSFTSAVPVRRLSLLLGHSFVLKPQYDVVACDSAQMGRHHNQVTETLKDEEVVSATCPLSVTGALSSGQQWVSALLYGLLNICTAEGLGSSQSLQLLNELLQTSSSTGVLTCQSFVNASCASTLTNSEEPFPWINLIDAQTKQTPLSSYLSGHEALQSCISAMYHKTFSGL
ncbi:NADP-dependent oxidoreductase domain-containing protein 1 isoform X2 [Brachyhypopomus gauderio]|uniref:NADP-dependent oxidoreductase domain-containing protein 1 isoform X2 n=1 Tax=Brachyhypopomus gauderio TaxID=698409 RepID=UPI0040419397